MGFSLPGQVGAGAQDALAELLAQRMQEQQMQQQQEAQRIAQALQQAQLEQRAREHQDDLGLREKQLGQQKDLADSARRERSNIEGLRLMERDAEASRPKPPKRHIITTIGKRGEPIQQLVDEDDPRFAEGIPQYREPRASGGGGAPDQQWVIRDGAPTPIPKGTARPGDLPYDVVAARKGDDGGSAGQYETQMVERAIEMIADLRKGAPASTGLYSIARKIPGTPQRDFSAQAEALKSNLIQNALGEMRANSKTGGAVGQLSEKEAEWLSATQGSLDVGQSPGAFLRQLDEIERRLTKYRNEVNRERTRGISPGVTIAPKSKFTLIPGGE